MRLGHRIRTGLTMALPMVAVAVAGGARAEDPGMARPVGPCVAGQVCRFEDPEDIADLKGTPWLVVSQGPGLAGFDTATQAVQPIAIGGMPCLPGSHGGGIGVRRERGGYRLVRILHGASGDAVETLRVTLRRAGLQASRTGCAAAPSPYFLNDIAPLPDGGFAATHMFDRAVPRTTLETAFLSGMPTGYVVRWSPATGWRALPGTEGTFPNGLDVSPDGKWIAFAEIYGHALNRVRLDGSGRTRIRLAMQPDNVTALGGARFLVVGGTGTPMTSTKRCPELKRPGCGFPARAVVVNFARGNVTTLVESGGASTPGFSVGVRKHGQIYLGTAFGDRITVVQADRTLVQLP